MTNKTVQNPVDPAEFVSGVEPARRREDGLVLLKLFSDLTGLEPVMWGPTIIGFGRYAYKYESGREGESMLTGFSPRKANLVMYIMPGYSGDVMADKLARLGKYKLGKSCLYINKLADVDIDVLSEIITEGVSEMRTKYEHWDR